MELLDEYHAGVYLRAVLHRLHALGMHAFPLTYTVRLTYQWQQANPGRRDGLELAPLEAVSSMNRREATVALVRVVRHLVLREVSLQVVLKGVRHIFEHIEQTKPNRSLN